MDSLTEVKRKEWRTWGKDAYKSAANMMRNNSHHPDYDTREKREAIHDANERVEGDNAYQFSENGRERLKSRFGYTDEMIEEARQCFIDGYKASRTWYKREDQKQQSVLDEYASVFEEASRIAHAVDVSDIKDGFPCGSAHVYLDYADRDTKLGKALRHFNNGHSFQYQLQIPIKIPSYGQCIAFDERICNEVVTFLRSRGIMSNVYSWID